jgi:hypothetical protein
MSRILLPIVLLLAACTPTTPPGQAMADLNREFAGRDSSTFFADFGVPVNATHADGGGKLYRWVSLEPKAQTSHITVFKRPGGTYGFQDASATNGDLMNGYCEISIRTDEDERITKLTLVNDSVGKYGSSRCAEIFSQPKKQKTDNN